MKPHWTHEDRPEDEEEACEEAWTEWEAWELEMAETRREIERYEEEERRQAGRSFGRVRGRAGFGKVHG